MTSVLVVDDSAVDRKLISTLLSNQTDWHIDVRNDGQQALAYVAEHQPDLVLSDMKMPNLDGLSLVGELRSKHPLIPVILITSFGSEELAMEALKEGAASYCPKTRMSRDLIAIARKILAVSLKRRRIEQVLSRVTESTISFTLENDSSLIPPMIEHLQSHMVAWDETDRLRVGVALDESLLNAMHHGNLEIDSTLRDQGDGSGYQKAIAQRNQESPFRDRKVKLDAKISSDEIKLSIADEGPGFLPETVPDPTSSENLHKPSGRGLLLIRTFMSEVKHNETGNAITMIKRRDPTN
ncbi:response regulator [Pirellulaceae bacterium]|nr:response regulator [Pirellulaceae bacterium]